jgi:ribosome-interacting GTPase 1
MAKVRTTIYLDKEKALALKRKATLNGISVSDLISISASEYDEATLRKQIKEYRISKANKIG